MKLRTDNRILLICDKYGNRVPFRMEKITSAILKAARKLGGFGHDVREGINSAIMGGRSDEDIAEFLAHDVMGRLNGNPQYLTPNTPAPLDEIHRSVIETLRFWGLRDVADEYQFYSSGRLWVRRGALRESEFSHHPYPEDLLAAADRWNKEHRCDTVDGVNAWVKEGRIGELVKASIARYEADLAAAAKAFLSRKGVRLFVVAGPTSSGKTTTTHKITQLVRKESGQDFVVFSADNYFYGVDLHPADQFGDRDYERARAYEIPLLRQHLCDLLDGKTIASPVFDFKTGMRVGTQPMSARADQVVILDCLHGFYPYITQGISRERVFRLYICNANRVREGEGKGARQVPLTLVNLMRRMLRDESHRGKSLLSTLAHWHYVRDGELTDMLPFIRMADATVNGGMPFDLPVLKTCLGGRFPMPDALSSTTPLDALLWSIDGARLLAGVAQAPDVSTAVIPPDSHIREFIGGLSLTIPHND